MADQRGSWAGGLTWLQKIALGLGIPASAAILYVLYRQYREDREERIPFVGDEEMEFVLKVPQEAVKFLLGRQGAKVNQLRRDTHARINVDLEDSGKERLIRITGSLVQVCKAKSAIQQILEESLPVVEKISVPNRTVGRIIGKGGESVRAMCRCTGAKIDCDREEGGSLSLSRLITISGTRKEVQAAKEMIREKLMEDRAFRTKLSQAANVRLPRKQPLGIRKEMAAGDQGEGPHSHPEPPGGRRDAGCLHQEAGDRPPEGRSGEPQEDSGAGSPINPWPALSSVFEVPSPDFSLQAKDHLEVYISASESPSHFWIQIIGMKALCLDKLMQEMTKHYNGSEDGELESVQVGDIVAAYYAEDSSWYRAKVLGTLENGNLDLYYVDFGDNGEVPLEKLRLLRGDFLGLPFQAIECSLAGVAPAGSSWEEAALDAFENLTHCAQWTPVFCKICTYQPVGSSVRPYVRLFRAADGQLVDVGQELIRLGYAVRMLWDGDGEDPRDPPGNPGNLAGTLLENLSEEGASLSAAEENTVML